MVYGVMQPQMHTQFDHFCIYEMILHGREKTVPSEWASTHVFFTSGFVSYGLYSFCVWVDLACVELRHGIEWKEKLDF